MNNWMQYLLEVNIYLAMAYGCYWLLFRRQTFYTANRVYLLVSTVVCFVIPLVQIDIAAYLPSGNLVPQNTSNTTVLLNPARAAVAETSFLSLNKATQAIYGIVATSMCAWLILKLYSLLKLISSSKRETKGNFAIVHVKNEHTPFSFFGYLFIDNDSQINEAMLQHELVHIRQKHSWDIMFMELVKIINWFNPVVYLLQNSLKALHEFEADRLAAGNQTATDSYVDFLIAEAYQSNGLTLAHQFSTKQLLKSRIMKLYQKRSGNLARLNYLVALPLCAGLLCASSLAFSKNYGWIKIGELTEMKTSLPDSLKQKLRLKVTSNGMTGITDKLEIKGYPGKKMSYTAQTLTAADKKALLQNFGISVETTTASATTTSLVLPPPPPPPVQASTIKSTAAVPHSSTKGSKSVYKESLLPPPPPPPSAIRFPRPKKTTKTAKAGTVKFPLPKAYRKSGNDTKTARDTSR